MTTAPPDDLQHGQQPEVQREYYGLQMLRAFAALGVVAYHGTQLWSQKLTNAPNVGQWFAGAAGVDIFFVISGFVMMLTSAKLIGRAGGTFEFLRRRLIRIVPLYWAVTTIKALALLTPAAHTMHARPTTMQIVGSYFFIPYLHSDGDVTVLITVGWTLVFEMFFYAVFALGLLTQRTIRKFLIFVTVVMIVMGVLSAYGTPHWPLLAGIANLLVLEFLAGIWLARLMVQRPTFLPRAVAAAICIAWVVYVINFYPWLHARLLYAGLPSLLVVAAVLVLETNLRRWIPAWLRLLGDASYSIYLVHGLLLPAVGIALVHAGAFEKPWARPASVALCLIVSSVAGVLVYKFAERPTTDWLKRHLRRKPRAAVLA